MNPIDDTTAVAIVFVIFVLAAFVFRKTQIQQSGKKVQLPVVFLSGQVGTNESARDALRRSVVAQDSREVMRQGAQASIDLAVYEMEGRHLQDEDIPPSGSSVPPIRTSSPKDSTNGNKKRVFLVGVSVPYPRTRRKHLGLGIGTVVGVDHDHARVALVSGGPNNKSFYRTLEELTQLRIIMRSHF